MKYIYELPMKVRDYECDLQGIVNNAHYQHYLEHTRHEFLLTTGVSFARWHEQGIDSVVSRITIQFKTPLHSGDEFISKLYVKRERIKYVFYQDIFRMSDNKLVVRAVVDTVFVIDGQLNDGKQFEEFFTPYLSV
ncbi:MAG: acyl-CoA thioesterase [Prevotellaceae bacterium]|jgi:acyl-CoA thioester hydrolase|nr:acyl-CoA thioesterase [Prevotellaceae bacterium]